ncbi:hypothetical protein D3C83_62250 [compost metagenome]
MSNSVISLYSARSTPISYWTRNCRVAYSEYGKKLYSMAGADCIDTLVLPKVDVSARPSKPTDQWGPRLRATKKSKLRSR